jgi:hypothetical protein
MANRPRVIIAIPGATECGMLADWLFSEGYDPAKRPTARSAADEIELTTRAFDLLIADATLAFREGLHALGRKRNPTTPTIVVGDITAARQCEAVGRAAMFLGRPIERVMLTCTVAMAIMEGRPVRCSPRKMVSPVAAVVNGVVSQIIDVSNEGLRLEIPTDRRWVPPPYFNVRVPLIGTAVTVQRMWTRVWPGNSSSRGEATWCGAALAQNRPAAERAWRGLVETIPVAGSSATNTIKVQ